MSVEFEVTTLLPASPDVIFDAWLDSQAHTEMTGGEADINAEVGAEFTAWDEYISGRNLEIEAPHRIVQFWRTVEFDDSNPDSRLEILLEPASDDITDATRITIRHTNLPANGMQYKQGWVDNYFEPMKQYFAR